MPLRGISVCVSSNAGKLYTAESSGAKAVINLKLASGAVYYDEKSPVYVDEAYLTAYFGKLDVSGGLKKLTWGKCRHGWRLFPSMEFAYGKLQK